MTLVLVVLAITGNWTVISVLHLLAPRPPLKDSTWPFLPGYSALHPLPSSEHSETSDRQLPYQSLVRQTFIEHLTCAGLPP